MKFTLSWLKEHLETDASLDEISDRLTAIGLEVEKIEDRAADYAAFTVGYVAEAKPHPNADRLTVCTVDTGDGTTDVVCGAPNARTGMKGVFAPAGTHIPGTGVDLEKATIRGVESAGMLCSERELGLSDEHEGIIELPDEAEIGAPFAHVMGLDDPVIEIDITPDRQDCLGVDGIARDLAAAGAGTVTTLAPEAVPGVFKSPVDVTLDFQADKADACPLFVGRYIRGVNNGPSPDWLQRKLLAIGLRPISALVDITNYLTMDRARPLHVFDADHVSGPIRARLGKTGEKLVGLDDNEYEIDADMCVIADESGPLGLAGVIGGVPSGVTEETTNVFIEAAYFDPIRTAMTGRKLDVISDARFRFERGVDPEFTEPGMEMATRLVQEICGGEASELVIAGSVPEWRRQIEFRPARVKVLTGIDIATDEMLKILGDLGFGTDTNGDSIRVVPPSWRNDIEGEADLVEEVARIHGYDSLPSTPLPRIAVITERAIDTELRRTATARRHLAALGLMEAITWAFIPAGLARLFEGGQPELTLENPISEDMNTMQPGLMPSLLSAVGRNIARGISSGGLFEIGAEFSGDTPEGQSNIAAGVRWGDDGVRDWIRSAVPVDAFHAKADALAVLEEIGAPVESAQSTRDAPAWYHPGRSGVIRLGPKVVLAAFGELHPRVLAELEIESAVVGFEIYLDAVPLPRSKTARSRGALDASDYPAVDRDFAFVVGADVPAGDIVRAARGAEKTLIADVGVFDVYEGENVGAGEKSVAISVRLEPSDRTLTDPEIEAVGEKIVAAVAKATGGTLRS